jgi:hypothetical protein
MLKHFKIAARAGYEPSMKCLKEVLSKGIITKKEYKEVFREYLASVEEMTSERRIKTERYCHEIDDATLFREQFPPEPRCQKCNIVLSTVRRNESHYMACCGSTLCDACIYTRCLRQLATLFVVCVEREEHGTKTS